MQFQAHSAHQLFVAVEGDNVLGFACSQPYRLTDALQGTVEVTIYLSPNYIGKGVGNSLYQHLFRELYSYNVHRALSDVALPNEASVALHKKFGFKEVSVFNEYAMKNGQYISSVWLEKRFC